MKGRICFHLHQRFVAKSEVTRRNFWCLVYYRLCQAPPDTPSRYRDRRILLHFSPAILDTYGYRVGFLTLESLNNVPYCFIKCTILFANVCLLDASAAISPYKGCVAVPLSENDLAFHESF